MVDFSGRFNCFFLSENDKHIYDKTIRIGRYYLNVDRCTQVVLAQKDGRTALVLGDAVNVVTGSDADIAAWLLDASTDMDSLIKAEKQLGGQYVILYAQGEGRLCVMGDATCSIPIFYAPEYNCFSDSYERIAEAFGLCEDADLVRIRESNSDPKRVMPYDITAYKEIFCLLPNHYWRVGEPKEVRFINAATPQERLTPEQAADVTHPMIMRLAEYYFHRYPLMCPITAGRDSRIVLAYLSKVSGNTVNAYTMRHKGVPMDSEMIRLSRQCCDLLGIEYTVLEDMELPAEWTEHLDHLLGRNAYSKKLASICYTMSAQLGDFAAVNGDIVGHIGKNTIHRQLPERQATGKYFSERLPNFSKQSPKIVEEWIKDVRDNGEKIDIYNLFDVESRLARMLGINNMMHSQMGQKYLNIFNSRSIIYTWTAVDRKERNDERIHQELLKRTVPELLDVPYETKPFSKRFFKKNNFLFRHSISVNYYIDKFKHRR